MRMEVPATSFVPTVRSTAKLHQLNRLGANIKIGGGRYADALAASQTWQLERNAMPIHAFDPLETMLGQASVALELEEQADRLDTVLVAVGGGGLLGGIAAWCRGRTRLIGVEPDKAPTLHFALAAGQPVDAPAGDIAADSLAPRQVGQLMLPLAQRHLDKTVLVSDEDTQHAQRILWRVLRTAVEPGG